MENCSRAKIYCGKNVLHAAASRIYKVDGEKQNGRTATKWMERNKMEGQQQSGWRETTGTESNKVDGDKQNGLRATKWMKVNKMDGEQQSGWR